MKEQIIDGLKFLLDCILFIFFPTLVYILYKIFNVSIPTLILLGIFYYVLLVGLSFKYDDYDSCGDHKFAMLSVYQLFIVIIMSLIYIFPWIILMIIWIIQTIFGLV